MNKDTASQSQAVPSELAEYKRVREEFVIAARNNGAFCIDSAMMNVDALIRAFSHSAATGKAEQDAADIDRFWNKAIDAEAESSRLRKENAALRAALKKITETPTQCVRIADAVLAIYN